MIKSANAKLIEQLNGRNNKQSKWEYINDPSR